MLNLEFIYKSLAPKIIQAHSLHNLSFKYYPLYSYDSKNVFHSLDKLTAIL